MTDFFKTKNKNTPKKQTLKKQIQNLRNIKFKQEKLDSEYGKKLYKLC